MVRHSHRYESIRELHAEEKNIMGTATMRKVIVTAKIENLEDLYDVGKGLLTDDQVRRVEVHDAVVDTGATTLLLPKRMIATLGLRPLRTRHSRTGRQFPPDGLWHRASDDSGSRLRA